MAPPPLVESRRATSGRLMAVVFMDLLELFTKLCVGVNVKIMEVELPDGTSRTRRVLIRMNGFPPQLGELTRGN